MKSVFLFLFSLFCITSCSLSNNEELNIQNKSELCIEIPNLKDSIRWNYSDIFSNISFVALESNSSSMVGKISELKITRNNDFIVLDKDNKKIVRFDSNGAFLNLIGECGRSATEYIAPTRIDYDSYENKVVVLDKAKKRLCYYFLNGKFDRSIQIDKFIHDFQILNKEKILIFFDYSEEGEGYNYWILDKTGNVISKFEQIPSQFNLTVFPNTDNVFTKENDNLLCTSPFSSLVYKIINDSIFSFMKITNKGNEWAIGEPIQIESSFYKRQNSISFIAQIKQKIFMIVKDKPYLYTYFFDSTDINRAHAGLSPNNDITNVSVIGKILTSDKNNIYYSIDPTSFESCLERSKKHPCLPPVDEKMLRRLSENGNPIIQICTVRN